MNQPAARVDTRVLVSGASGTIGRAVLAALEQRGAQVARLVRTTPANRTDVPWRPMDGWIDLERLSAFSPHAVIHLAGESVFGWFSRERKRRILESRVHGTRTIASALSDLPERPGAFLSASAVGFYGDGGDRELDETAPPGQGFLAGVCRSWEAETAPAASEGIRTVMMRIGVVISPTGGALATMRPLFRAGLGGPIAGGRAWVPWISLDDTVAAMLHLLHTPAVSGPVNLVGPRPVMQGELARSLGALLRRPAILPVPGWALSTALGEMARETVLKSVRAVPRALIASGYEFTHPTVERALAAALGLEQPVALPTTGVVS